MSTRDDELWRALEGLRESPVVRDGLAHARRWERSRGGAGRWAGVLLGLSGAAIATALLLVPLLRESPLDRSIVKTGVGEIRTVMLTDGSHVTIDATSRLRHHFTREHRDIELLEGTAHFEVAKDPARPFRVRAGATEVVALGTVFDVAAKPMETTVTLIEGRINVQSIAASTLIEPVTRTLDPGQQIAIAADGRLLAAKTAVLEQVTAWQRGQMNFDDTPLGSAVAQVNRYSTVKVSVPDPDLAAARISGLFRTGDTRGFVAALERLFGLRADWTSSRSVILRHAPPPT